MRRSQRLRCLQNLRVLHAQLAEFARLAVESLAAPSPVERQPVQVAELCNDALVMLLLLVAGRPGLLQRAALRVQRAQRAPRGVQLRSQGGDCLAVVPGRAPQHLVLDCEPQHHILAP
jgi:hypothetical protein